MVEAMESRKGYTQTEVVITENWEVRVFKSIYSESSRNGIYKSSKFKGHGIRIVNMGEMFGLDFISVQEMSRVALTSKELLLSGLQEGDLLFGRRSVVPAGAGKCSIIVALKEPLTFESSIIRVRLNWSEVNPLFYYYFFASQTGRSVMSAIVSGTNIKGIRASDLKELKVPVPTKTEQTAIVTALNDADALITQLEKLIAKKRNIKQGAMQELLKPNNGWQVKKLGEIAHIKTGAKNNEDKLENGEYPFFVRSAKVERINCYSYDCEAILIPGDGNIGEIYHYINGKFEVHQRVYKISDFSEGILGKYLYLWFKMFFKEHAYRYTAKNTVDSLRLPIFKDFEIKYPSITEQNHITQILSDMDAEIEALEKKLNKYKMLKQGMMQNLLTGKIRLI